MVELKDGMKYLVLNWYTVGGELKRARRVAGLSQKDVSEKCGIHLNTVGNIERGTVLPNLDSIRKMCGLYGYDGITIRYDKEIAKISGDIEVKNG